MDRDFHIIVFENGVGREVPHSALKGYYYAFKGHDDLFYYADSVRASSFVKKKSKYDEALDAEKSRRQAEGIADFLMGFGNDRCC